MEGRREMSKGLVCVTGGTGFVASWLIMKLLHHGYTVNTTIRQGGKRDISFLTDLPNAADRLRVFDADLRNPESFKEAIQGCMGVFHVAHPAPNVVASESEETISDEAVRGLVGILQLCLHSGSVKRVVYTSSVSAVMFNTNAAGMVLDESSWSDMDYIRKMNLYLPAASHFITKTKTERAALEFANKHGMDLVTVVPSCIHGPFICPNLPDSVRSSLAIIIEHDKKFKYMKRTPFVHTDDVAEAHIHLFEHPGAQGRYICSAVEPTVEDMLELLSSRYPDEFHEQHNLEITSNSSGAEFGSLSSNKLVETGFNYKYGLEDMFNDAIHCSKVLKTIIL